MIRFILHATNVALILAMVGCLTGALVSKCAPRVRSSRIWFG
jgi:hypothetical protein